MNSHRPGPASPVSELLLLTVHLATATGFIRLFETRAFLRPLFVIILISFLTAVGCRRLRVPGLVTPLIAIITSGLTISHVLFGDTLRFSLPTTETVQAVETALRVAREQFGEVVAPTEATDGFVLLLALASIGAVWFADWGAFRVGTTAESIGPSAMLFVTSAVLGSGRHRAVSTGLFVVTTAAFVLVHHADRARTQRVWLDGRERAGARAILVPGAVTLLVAASLGMVVAPVLPGAESDPIIRWRRQAAVLEGRTTISPMVSLRPRLVDQADTPLFRVRADQPAYWRLTGLDEFDGTIWRIDASFREASGPLGESAAPARDERNLDQDYTIQALDDLWVPAALRPVAVEGSNRALRWDPESSTLIVDRDQDTVRGLHYRVTSIVPKPSSERLRGADDRTEMTLRPLTDLPDDFPEEVSELARQLTAAADTRYDAMLALQRFFRTEFEYSTDGPEGHDGDALTAFLDRRVGYCEQFAGSFAAMARSLGVPARVGIGFTTGEPVAGAPDTYQVRGRHAHAWPEIHFTGIGWVPFEPTPGRGIPGASGHTGVPPMQDEAPADDRESTTPTTGPAPTPERDDEPRRPEPRIGTGDDAIPASDPDARTAPWIAGAAAISTVLLALLLAIGTRLLRRRRIGGAGARDEIIDAWDHTVRAAARVTGDRPRPDDTRVEYAHRIIAALPHDPPAALIDLADLADAADYGPDVPSRDRRERARVLSATLLARLDREPQLRGMSRNRWISRRTRAAGQPDRTDRHRIRAR